MPFASLTDSEPVPSTVVPAPVRLSTLVAAVVAETSNVAPAPTDTAVFASEPAPASASVPAVTVVAPL